jgi:transcriptional regulator with XRE-family HTH domain
MAMEIGAAIKSRREQRNLSQAQLASALGISQATIQKIEVGHSSRSRHLQQIWAYLDLPREELRQHYLKDIEGPDMIHFAGHGSHDEHVTALETKTPRQVAAKRARPLQEQQWVPSQSLPLYEVVDILPGRTLVERKIVLRLFLSDGSERAVVLTPDLFRSLITDARYLLGEQDSPGAS